MNYVPGRSGRVKCGQQLFSLSAGSTLQRSRHHLINQRHMREVRMRGSMRLHSDDGGCAGFGYVFTGAQGGGTLPPQYSFCCSAPTLVYLRFGGAPDQLTSSPSGLQLLADRQPVAARLL
jgi:hypothetical protein